ncbi:MAG: serine/threonine-protein kinase [Actinomycetota bacterium]
MAEKPHGGKIGRYRINAPIGSGGFATVYRAVDERLGSEVALKVLAENHSLVPDIRERFISEAQHLRRVDSYWVASIFDLGETDTGQPYMVLELADRGDLETRVNDLWDNARSLDREDLLVLAETLAHSLSAIHATDLVHRDVTPGNLLVRHNGLRHEPWAGDVLLERGERLLLSDLGYAKDLRIASGITSGGGTAGFAAPEQTGEMTHVDTRADVFGATAVLEWAATGSRFEQALADVARVGMADDPADRFEDMSSWNAAVRNALTGPYSPSAVTAGRIEDSTPPWVKQMLTALAGLSIGFICAAILWFDWANEDDQPTAPTETTVATTATTEPEVPQPPSTATSTSAAPEGPSDPFDSRISSRTAPTPPRPQADDTTP